ncbi:MAG: SMI1/KNR4 family protein [Phycisphaerales bacterium]|nr:SMI1/KNR4 family protein [Phycisphaerales bacterium]
MSLIRAFRETCLHAGLTSGEFDAITNRFGITFPDDLRLLLSGGLPTGDRWPNWREALNDADAAAELRARLEWPLEGALFDVEHNSFWDPEWGLKPTDTAEANRVATIAIRNAPALIPVYSHRFIPAEPLSAGNPIFSVYQMDIIVYGRDLFSYLQAESGGWSAELVEPAREIRCWTRWMNVPWHRGD